MHVAISPVVMYSRQKPLPPRPPRKSIRRKPVPVLSRAEYATLREEIIRHASSYASYNGVITVEEYANDLLKNLTVEHDQVSNISVCSVAPYHILTRLLNSHSQILRKA
jgi:hypothetical protein